MVKLNVESFGNGYITFSMYVCRLGSVELRIQANTDIVMYVPNSIIAYMARLVLIFVT